MDKKKAIIISSFFLLSGILAGCNKKPETNPETPKEPHVHSYTYVSNGDATCLHNGTKTGTCECGDTIKVSDVGSKLGHNFTKKDPSEKYLAYKGDCEHKDIYYYACNECGAIGTETYEFGEENAHEYGEPQAFGYDKVIYECKNCHHVKTEERFKQLDIYATNDFHGNFHLDETSDENELTQFGVYFNEKGKLENTLLIDQGDTWHGGYDSNSNYGALVNEVMAYAGFDSRTVGNHDFNWGLEVIKTNTRSGHNGYRVPVLAANIYDYDFDKKTFGNVQQNEIGQEYVVKVLENGLKVGIVGVIPEDQVFTINENLINNIGFKNYVNCAKEICLKLRNEEHCDIVICSVHEGVANASKRLVSLTENMPSSDKKYCDIVLCSHTHKLEKSFINDVLFFQNDAQLKNFRQVNMKYDSLTKKVLYDEVKDLVSNISNEKYSNISRELLDIISKYKKGIIEGKRKVVHNNVVGDFTMEQGAYLMAKALADEATRQNEKPDYTFVVRAKGAAKNEDGKYVNAFNKGTLTYDSFFGAYESDYQIYTFFAKGSDVKALLAQGAGRMNKGMDNGIVELYCYKDPSMPGYDDIDVNATYKICAEDVLAYHTKYLRYGKALDGYNEGSYDDSVEYTREFDYFATINHHEAKMIKRANGDMYHFRDILENYLARHIEPLDPLNYSRSSNFLKGNDYNVKIS